MVIKKMKKIAFIIKNFFFYFNRDFDLEKIKSFKVEKNFFIF
jgi:hypothetical protein